MKTLPKFFLSFLLGLHLSFCIAFFLSRSSRVSSCQAYLEQYSRKRHVKKTRDLLFVGIMTAEKYLDSRAKTIASTWKEHIPGDVMFFISNDTKHSGKLSTVRLNVKDNSYPPQKKSFEMLRYMHDHYIDKYEWFLRADDDVYIKGYRLGYFLRSLDSRQVHYIGHPGNGIKEEQGKLGLVGDHLYCMGGPGVIFSNAALRQLVNFIDACLNFTVTSHEDTEVGRCVQLHLNKSCVQSYEAGRIFYQNYREIKGSFTHKLGADVVHALTLHPVKQPMYMYRLHIFIIIHKLLSLETRRALFAKQIQMFDNIISGETHEQSLQIQRYQMWNFLANSNNAKFTGENSRTMSSQHLLKDGELSLFKNISTKVLRKDKRAKYKNIHFGSIYQRVVYNKGVDYKINSHILNAKSYSQWGVASVQVTKTFRTLRFYEESERLYKSQEIMKNGRPEIVVILSLVFNSEAFETFIRYYTNASERKSKTRLLIALHEYQKDIFKSNIEYIHKLNKEHKRLGINIVYINVPKITRIDAIRTGTKNLANNSILLFVDQDMLLTKAFLNKVLLNTVEHRQVYSPITFMPYDEQISCYPYNNCSTGHNILSGTWRRDDYQTLAIFNSDYHKISASITKLNSWQEYGDILSERCLTNNLTIVRSVDPDAIYTNRQSKYCAKNPDTVSNTNCDQYISDAYGPIEKLAKIIEVIL